MLETSAFENGARIPARYGCEGRNVSPPLGWRGAPAETKSFALICEDPDAPGGMFYHWAIFDIPAGRSGLPEGYRPAVDGCGPVEAINGFGQRGYAGPCPPKGHGVHHYRFGLVALDVERLPLEAGSARCTTVAQLADVHALGSAEIVGIYER
jgi:Raf kinase inhibitor-like YbhB/YbcL family protein